MRIGRLAARAGTSVPTIRYYEQIGLLPRADRMEGGQRLYTERDVERLAFVRRCRDFGFSIDQVRSLAALGQDRRRSCRDLRDIAAGHLAGVHAKVRELQALADSLTEACAVATRPVQAAPARTARFCPTLPPGRRQGRHLQGKGAGRRGRDEPPVRRWPALYYVNRCRAPWRTMASFGTSRCSARRAGGEAPEGQQIASRCATSWRTPASTARSFGASWSMRRRRCGPS